MNRVLWVLLLVILVAGCQSKPDGAAVKSETAAVQLKVAPDHPITVQRAGPVDPVVAVSGPSTVVVKQGERVVVVIRWRHSGSGQVTVPLRAVDDGSGSLQIAVTNDPVEVSCPPCMDPDHVMNKCCD
ncbi:MAG TPA: hypothetical protein VKB80_00010 [Kofleriaceae bacterium]|nr:hypothetical protein [Kofleriaceae bacterium]